MEERGFKLPEKYFEKCNKNLFQQIQVHKNRQKNRLRIWASISMTAVILLLFYLKPLLDINNETRNTKDNITLVYLWSESIIFDLNQNDIETDDFFDIDIIHEDAIFDYISDNSIYLENHISFTNY